MLRLTADRGEISSANTLAVEIAGAESNTLMALARLGLCTAWALIGNTPLSKRIIWEIRAGGVDVSHVHWTDGGERAELVFTEPGVRPRPTLVHYDRQHAAIHSLQLADIAVSSLMNTRVYHFTGILPSLSKHCREHRSNSNESTGEKEWFSASHNYGRSSVVAHRRPHTLPSWPER